MEPQLELVQIHSGESFIVWAHGYPFRTVRWHFHPEYEIHLITDTNGHYFVGDFIGDFVPGNLVMTGPNLPHNWISDVPEGTTIPRRCIVLQFTQTFIESCIGVFPELEPVATLLDESRRGLLFRPEAGETARKVLTALLNAHGAERIALFVQLLGLLTADRGRKNLTSAGYLPDPSAYMSGGMNRALAYVGEHLEGNMSEGAIAAIAGMTPGGFSRAFKRHTGMTFVHYVNRMRINLACQLLMSEKSPVTDICFRIGFNNLSNFNRHFALQKGMSPSRFRALFNENRTANFAA
ncbi:AraC family transcriptional regulator [Labrys portucalensis]|uniref:AraC family transcriptional regulator n=1 Tax=Labrys neptuniae TaxID=376174 RepID=A0ABV3PXI3_9HYPH|nr:AraC family transcriptional regulator [Labrys neptuniae]MDT3381844.1 AraC family transcriptional regulator [Labrys neptuniae]